MTRKTLAGDRRRRKLFSVLWGLGLAVLVMVLIYLELTAILYVLCTVGVTALLIVVAFADLDQRGESKGQPVAQASGPEER